MRCYFYNQPEEKVFAYVSVDINPSLEVSVTKDLRVIDLQACNDDGRRILKELKQWENKQLQEVIRAIIKQSQEDKYLTNDKQVMLTAIAKDKLLEPKLEKVMKELKKEYELKHITVEYQSSTMQVRENARKAGIGTGVYIMQENEKNKSVTPPATPSNQVENEEEVQSQPESSPDVARFVFCKRQKYEKPEHKEQKKIEEQPTKQIKENNSRGSQQENRGNQQENNGRESQQGNNGNQQGNDGRESQQGNNGNQQGNNGRGSQGNNGHQQENNGRGSQGNNGNQQGNNGRGSQGNNGNQQGNNGRVPQGNNGNQQGDNGRDLNKEIMGTSKVTMEEDPKKKMLETSKETMVGDLNKRIEATSKGMKRRINRNIEVGDSF